MTLIERLKNAAKEQVRYGNAQVALVELLQDAAAEIELLEKILEKKKEKTLGQIAWEATHEAAVKPWSDVGPLCKEDFETIAQAVVAEHERRIQQR